VELYNAGNSAIDLSDWKLSDNDGNTFNLSSATNFASDNYIVCYLAQSGTNSSTAIYSIIENAGPNPSSMLDANDDLTLLDNNDAVIDYVAWGADPGTDDDDAVNAGQWTAGNYVDTTGLSEGDSLGRDKDSNDTDLPDDWENPSSSQADPYGVNATVLTQGARNLDIPEFDDLIFPIMFIALVYFCFSKRFKSYTMQVKYNPYKLKKSKDKQYSNYKKFKVYKKSNSSNKKIK
jgi:hypothetical protein